LKERAEKIPTNAVYHPSWNGIFQKPVDSKKPKLKLVQISFWAMYNLDSHRRYSHSLAQKAGKCLVLQHFSPNFSR